MTKAHRQKKTLYPINNKDTSCLVNCVGPWREGTVERARGAHPPASTCRIISVAISEVVGGPVVARTTQNVRAEFLIK